MRPGAGDLRNDGAGPIIRTEAWGDARPGGTGVIDGLVWRFNRLRCMTPAEIGHRVIRTLKAQAERFGALGTGEVPVPDLSADGKPWIATDAGVDPAPYLAAADRIVEGRFDVFALKDVELGSPPRWNRDPKTGIEAPLTFGKLLDYRDERLVGDIKYLWEPNRHLHIVTLAQAWALSRDRKYFETLRRHLESWFDACPYRLGPNWASALEPAVRLANWAVAWQLLGGAGSPLFRGERGARLRTRWLNSVHQHAEFICGNFSLYSSANNHLLGEAAGVFLASVTWPYWEACRRWRKVAKAILERDALLQNAPDGVNLEQATSYQQFTFDLLLLPLLAGRANGIDFSEAYVARMERMLEFVASIMDAGGNVPMIGDADDAVVVRFSQERHFCSFRSQLATGAVLFGRGDFRRKAGMLDDKTRWLFGRRAQAAFQAARTTGPLPVRRAFPEGGYWILGCDFETDDEIRMVVDAGPLGYQSIAAHGHADALAFTLSLGGFEFLVDPGTYAYHTQAPWRRYFRGTAAHNTVRIDGQDQSRPGGNFMWLRKARARCERWDPSAERDVFEGWHDGYARLADPVVHRRIICLDKLARTIRIDDVLLMEGEHEVELNFHASEACAVEREGDGYRLRRARHTLKLVPPDAPGATCTLHVGSESPIRGWVSRSFDTRVPSPTITWRARLAGPVTLTTIIYC